MTLSDPEPQFQGHSLKANISQTVQLIHSMFGSRVGFPAELRYQPEAFIHALLSRVPLRQLGFLVTWSSLRGVARNLFWGV